MLSIQETQAILTNADLIVDEKTIHEAIAPSPKAAFDFRKLRRL